MKNSEIFSFIKGATVFTLRNGTPNWTPYSGLIGLLRFCGFAPECLNIKICDCLQLAVALV